MQLILEFPEDVGDLLLNLEFESVEVLLDGHEMLLLLLLPLQQAFIRLLAYYGFVYRVDGLLVLLNAGGNLCYACVELEHAQLVAVMLLLELIVGDAFLAEERAGLALGINADVCQEVLGMVSALHIDLVQEAILKHLNIQGSIIMSNSNSNGITISIGIILTIIIINININRIIIQQALPMLKKKNYKDEDHFTQYYTATIPQTNGKILTIYYKRYRPKRDHSSSINIYTALHTNTNAQAKEEQKSEYPVDRTLEVISFDQELTTIGAIMKKVGKVRKCIYGQSKLKGKDIWYAIVIFKYEFDLVKCFRDNGEYLQVIVDDLEKAHAGEDDKEAYRQELICGYLGKELAEEQGKLKQLQDQGYNVITDKFGKYSMSYEANQKFVQDLPQVRKMKKESIKAQKNAIKAQKNAIKAQKNA